MSFAGKCVNPMIKNPGLSSLLVLATGLYANKYGQIDMPQLKKKYKGFKKIKEFLNFSKQNFNFIIRKLWAWSPNQLNSVFPLSIKGENNILSVYMFTIPLSIYISLKSFQKTL